MRLSVLFSIALALGCGGSVSIIQPAPVEAQSFSLVSLSNQTQYNSLQVSGPVGSGYVMQVIPGTPATILTNTGVATVDGVDKITITCNTWASCTNAGTYTILSHAIGSNCPSLGPYFPNDCYTVTCPSCTSYTDALSVSATYDAFGQLVKDANGNFYSFFYEGCNHTSSGCTPSANGVLKWMKLSSTGAILAGPTLCASDASNDVRAAGLGLLQNGKIQAWFWKVAGGVTYNGLFHTEFDGTACNTPTQLPNPSPDGSNWQSGFGPVAECGSGSVATMTNVNGRQYLVNLDSTGAPTGTYNRITSSLITDPPTNESAVACPSSTERILFSRNDSGQLSFWYSLDSGSTWTASYTPTNGSTTNSTFADVAPWLVNGPTSGTYLLTYGERDSGACGVLSYCAAGRAVTFKAADLIVDATSISVPQVIPCGAGNSLDSTYMTPVISGSSLLLQCYMLGTGSASAKLYTQTAAYQASAGALPHNGEIIVGTVR